MGFEPPAVRKAILGDSATTDGKSPAPPPNASGPPDQIVDASKLADLTKWMATGFAALSAIATFFGIKDGNLDAVVRENPSETLYIACLVGAGVVGALVS